ncbi:1-acyl-sn-glycerol-3-phosphate acyltransferase [bacterium]|nr:1-acyl-sn-glycerol-3-phosphate acyltransferase [bacterium]
MMGFWYRIGHTIAKLLGKFMFSYRVFNREAFDAMDGGTIIASNHVSFLDPPLIGSAIRTPIYYFARKTLFDHPVSGYLFTRCNALPVNQDKPEISVLKQIIELLKQEKQVLIFPEGERSWDGVMNMEAQPGIGMIVAKSKKPVLPIRIFGAEKALPRGGKKLVRTPVQLVVGEPINFDDLVNDSAMGTKEKYQLIANRIMEAIAALEVPVE